MGLFPSDLTRLPTASGSVINARRPAAVVRTLVIYDAEPSKKQPQTYEKQSHENQAREKQAASTYQSNQLYLAPETHADFEPPIAVRGQLFRDDTPSMQQQRALQTYQRAAQAVFANMPPPSTVVGIDVVV